MPAECFARTIFRRTEPKTQVDRRRKRSSMRCRIEPPDFFQTEPALDRYGCRTRARKSIPAFSDPTVHPPTPIHADDKPLFEVSAKSGRSRARRD